MSFITPISVGEFPRNTRPLGNVQPFTYRDGTTYLEILEALRSWLKDYMVPFLNIELGEVNAAWTSEVTTLIEAVDIALAEQAQQVNERAEQWLTVQISNNDIITSAIVDNPASLTRISLDIATAETLVDAASALHAAIVSSIAEDTPIRDAVVSVGEGRYRRVLHELRDVAPGADARAVVQNAVNAASGTGYSELVIPEGAWDFDTSTDAPASGSAIVRISNDNVRVLGAGIGKTVIKSALTGSLFAAIGAPGARLSNVEVSDMTLEGILTAGSQQGVSLYYTDNARASRLKVSGMGNNGAVVHYSDGTIFDDIEVSEVNDFGILFYRSTNGKVVDAFIHDISEGRAHLGIQFKNSSRCEAIRPRIERVQGYGFYTWNDGIGAGAFPDFGHTLEDAYIADTLSGGTFNAQSVYVNETEGMAIRGGRFVGSAAGLISARNARGIVVSDIAELTGALAGPALGISGSSSFSVSNVHADGKGASNAIGALFSGLPVFGSLRNSRFINGAATGSVGDNAACRVEDGISGLFIDNNDFSDYQAVKTQRRGMYDRGTSNVNYWRFNKATGNTASNKQIPAGAIDTGNVSV